MSAITLKTDDNITCENIKISRFNFFITIFIYYPNKVTLDSQTKLISLNYLKVKQIPTFLPRTWTHYKTNKILNINNI